MTINSNPRIKFFTAQDVPPERLAWFESELKRLQRKGRARLPQEEREYGWLRRMFKRFEHNARLAPEELERLRLKRAEYHTGFLDAPDRRLLAGKARGSTINVISQADLDNPAIPELFAD